MEDVTQTAPRVPACEKCHAGAMERVTVAKFHGSVSFLGWLIIAGTLLFTLVTLSSLADLLGLPESPMRSEAIGGQVLELLIGAVVGIGLWAFLTGRRSIWRCPACGYFFRRA